MAAAFAAAQESRLPFSSHSRPSRLRACFARACARYPLLLSFRCQRVALNEIECVCIFNVKSFLTSVTVYHI